MTKTPAAARPPAGLYADLGAGLLHSGPVPLYFQVAQRLEKAILDGRIAARTLLPGEGELSMALGCSTWVVKRAITHLAGRGLVIRRRGVGSVIADSPSLSAPDGVTEGPSCATDGTVRSVAVDETIVSLAIAERLGLGAARRALRVTRIVDVDDSPIAVMDSYVAPDAHLDEARIERLGLYRALEACRARPVHGVEEYRMRIATRRESELLGLPADSWLFTAERTMVAADGRTVEHAVHVYRPDRAVARHIIR